MTENYYSLLGVAEGSTTEQILTEYRIKSLMCHPDKGGSRQGSPTLLFDNQQNLITYYQESLYNSSQSFVLKQSMKLS